MTRATGCTAAVSGVSPIMTEVTPHLANTRKMRRKDLSRDVHQGSRHRRAPSFAFPSDSRRNYMGRETERNWIWHTLGDALALHTSIDRST